MERGRAPAPTELAVLDLRGSGTTTVVSSSGQKIASEQLTTLYE